MSDEERFSLRTPGTEELRVREIQATESEKKPRKGKPTAAEVAVIEGWIEALSAGQVNRASDYFEIPSTVVDALGQSHALASTEDVRAFNRSQGCGARLTRARRGDDSFVRATFELSERPGGQCQNPGLKIAARILVENRHVVRLLLEPPAP